MADEEQLNWNVDLEVSLFHAIHAHRPIGINRNFQMIFLHDKLNSALDKKVSSKSIWSHLKRMYDLAALNDSDGIPFPNKECDFTLPEDFDEELVNKTFPRHTKIVDSKPTEAEINKESVSIFDTPTSKDAGETKVPTSRGKAGATSQSSGDTAPKQDSVLKAVYSAIDSPKPDPRKRTRQSLQSPQTDATSTPSSAKRVRRI